MMKVMRTVRSPSVNVEAEWIQSGVTPDPQRAKNTIAIIQPETLGSDLPPSLFTRSLVVNENLQRDA